MSPYDENWTPPKYEEFWPVEDFFWTSHFLYVMINKAIHGRIGMNSMDCGTLERMIVLGGEGDHLEIGSLFGGSAILAAMIKRNEGHTGTVHCIDSLLAVGRDVITPNAKKCGVVLELHVQDSSMLPELLPGKRFRTALIDGTHVFEVCYRDWLNVSRVTDKYIMLHDYDSEHPGVDQAVRAILQDGWWRPVLVYGHSIVLERRKE